MEGKNMKKRTIVLAVIVVLAALARLAPHPSNVTPIAAMALFGGACFTDRRLAYLLPLAAMLLSDLVLGTTRYGILVLLASQPAVYACFMATTALGQLIRDRRSVWQIGAATLGGSVLFFVVTNFAVWATATEHLYPQTGSGLMACYAAGIPYFRNSLLGDAAFTTILFGGLALLENRWAWMRKGALPVSV
jgi:hypothetical protein